MADKDTTQLIVKCVQFYIDAITQKGSKCPTVDEMREIIKLDDIIKSLKGAQAPAK